jgi:hypothetical protein
MTMTARTQRILAVAVGAVALFGLIAVYVTVLMQSPPAAARSVNLTLQTVGALGSDYEKPDWVKGAQTRLTLRGCIRG